MTDSRETVLKSIRFESPGRIPTLFREWGNNDIAFLDFGVRYTPIDNRHQRDEFGCVWEYPEGHTIGYVVHHPLDALEDLDRFCLPDPDEAERFRGLKRQAEAIRERGVAVACNYLAMLWERLWFLRGFENTLVEVWQRPQETARLLDALSEFMIRLLQNAQEAAGGLIDIWCSTDDWGLQSGAFIPPKLFRTLFAPRYSRIFAACREAGMYSYLHSDGNIAELIPELITAGLQILEVEDLRVKRLERLAYFRGRICMLCTLDAQSTMTAGNRQAIRAEAEQIVAALAAPEGGLIAGIYWDPVSCGVDPETQAFAVEAFQQVCERFGGRTPAGKDS